MSVTYHSLTHFLPHKKHHTSNNMFFGHFIHHKLLKTRIIFLDVRLGLEEVTQMKNCLAQMKALHHMTIHFVMHMILPCRINLAIGLVATNSFTILASFKV